MLDFLKNKNIYLLFVISAASLLGGVMGSFAYLDYRNNDSGPLISQIGNQSFNVTENSQVIEVSKKLNPSVVSITVKSEQLNFFGGLSESTSSGTGFFVSKDGLIVTNKHVVGINRSKYSVITSTGDELEAKVVATDPVYDIALIDVEGSNFQPVEFGDSENLVTGQTAIAIGNALGQYQNSVTVGVISAVGRVIEAGDSGGSVESLENLIQTDAAINPGNSGGPLLNIAGQAIGINTAIDSSGQGIGFAIPINNARQAVDSYLKTGKIDRPVMGVRYIPINKEFAARNDLQVNEGAYLYATRGSQAVIPGSPAEKAGLMEGDIITHIGNDKITNKTSLISLINKYKVGETLEITYLRDNKEQKTSLKLASSN